MPTKRFSTSWSTSFSPRPSMSIARRLAKWRIASLRCAGQPRPAVQRVAACPSTRTAGAPHTGHSSGISNTGASGARLSGSTARRTCGITSPARRTTTRSPTRTSLRVISSWLWRVALVTVTPPTNTGSSRATGVRDPVRPTCTSIPRSVVTASSAGNLWASAQRGARDTAPRRRWSARRLTLYTTPSIW